VSDGFTILECGYPFTGHTRREEVIHARRYIRCFVIVAAMTVYSGSDVERLKLCAELIGRRAQPSLYPLVLLRTEHFRQVNHISKLDSKLHSRAEDHSIDERTRTMLITSELYKSLSPTKYVCPTSTHRSTKRRNDRRYVSSAK